MLRGGYGLYWAPYNYPAPSTHRRSNYGQVGFTQNTSSPQTAAHVPTVTLANPFPNGLVQPSGSSLGLARRRRHRHRFVDQNRSAPRVQQYSVDLQRELPGNMAITFSYIGARGDHLAARRHRSTPPVNINQLDPKYLALGATALSTQVPNPFFGISAAGPFATRRRIARASCCGRSRSSATSTRGRCTEGKNRYNAAVVEWTKRLEHGWFGGRVSYTYSVLKDNQIGETNFYSAGGITPLNNYNYIPSAPACSTDNPDRRATTRCGVRLRHSRRAAPRHRRADFELPFGKGKKFGNSAVGDALPADGRSSR